ncbi:MAG: dephospho-CoA kinase [bacterium]
MKILALTGGIATGKSVVADMFRELGATVIDADRVAHRAYLPGTRLYQALKQRYGAKILATSGKVDRKRLARILFRSKRERAWLESRIHPETRRLIGAELQKAIRRGAPLILVEAALHVETGYHRPFHGLVVVDAPAAVQEKRLRRREGLGEAEARLKLRSQLPQARKLALADWVIDNSGSLSKTRAQVRKLMKSLAEKKR